MGQELMPAAFIGHGGPLNTLERDRYAAAIATGLSPAGLAMHTVGAGQLVAAAVKYAGVATLCHWSYQARASPSRLVTDLSVRGRGGALFLRPLASGGAVRHWFEIGLINGVLEHGARLELRLLKPHARGSPL